MLFSKFLSLSCNVGEPLSALHEVQGCNSVTKTSDISNRKYRSNVSYKYKTPMALCNLFPFEDILSRSSRHFWKVCKFCPLQAPILPCRLSSPRLLWFLRIPAWRQRLLYFSETAVLDATQKVGVGCPPELCLPVMGAAAEQSTRCHCSSTANCLLEHFLG